MPLNSRRIELRLERRAEEDSSALRDRKGWEHPPGVDLAASAVRACPRETHLAALASTQKVVIDNCPCFRKRLLLCRSQDVIRLCSQQWRARIYVHPPTGVRAGRRPRCILDTQYDLRSFRTMASRNPF